MNSAKETIDAVVTIDIQVDYFPGGAFPLFKPKRALKNARAVLDRARQAGIPIFHIKHEGQSSQSGGLRSQARFLREGTPGAELHPGLGLREREMVIVKHEPDSFLGTELEARLRDLGAKKIMWMGMMSWMCVDTTVRAAKARGFENILVEDACAAGWMAKGWLPVFPWSSHRAVMAALGYHHAKLVRARDALRA
jgi:nicotinamidase-related amidase